jgi:hypothetical protein
MESSPHTRDLYKKEHVGFICFYFQTILLQHMGGDKEPHGRERGMHNVRNKIKK